MIKKVYTNILSFIFPESCYLCKANGAPLCFSCLQNIPRAVETPAPYIVSKYSYKDHRIKKIIHAAKYFHRKDLLISLSQSLAEEVILTSETNIYILPIPMPRMRKYTRGYNHTEIIAEEISRKTCIPCVNNILLRDKQTQRQVEVRSRSARLNNQKHAFTVSTDLTGMSILLVDDVTTTGATLHEARKILLKNGARSVSALTIAH